jgi:3-deoxy-D-manno-octulosonate 8-phosphate phosphatase (KDO 8-P phosphatase)
MGVAGTSPRPAEELERRLANARLLVFDVDGTLTDGGVNYVGDQELCRFHVHDGQGLVWLAQAGLTLAWISGRGSRAVERRALELGVKRVVLGAVDKAAALERMQAELGIGVEHTLAMGDDLPDLALAARAVVFVAPANARPEVRERAAFVTAAKGGEGAVRELAERVLAARGEWEARVARALAPGETPAGAKRG